MSKRTQTYHEATGDKLVYCREKDLYQYKSGYIATVAFYAYRWMETEPHRKEHDGHMWSKISVADLAAFSGFLSTGRVRRGLQKLVDGGTLRRAALSDDFNTTYWYTLGPSYE